MKLHKTWDMDHKIINVVEPEHEKPINDTNIKLHFHTPSIN